MHRTRRLFLLLKKSRFPSLTPTTRPSAASLIFITTPARRRLSHPWKRSPSGRCGILTRSCPNPTPQHPDAGNGPPLNEANRLTPLEWYTLSENLYRAYQFTGDSKYKTFGDVWRYPHYWGMFTGSRGAHTLLAPRLQPLQLTEQRSHDVRGDRRSRISEDHRQRLRLV